MRALRKSPEPEVLVRNKAAWTAGYLQSVANGTKPRAYWGRPELRDALRLETNDHCAYCDSKVSQVAQFHIEHYRPRARYPQLVLEWANLTVACPRCNSEKRDKFSEKLRFVNPFEDVPSEHFVFLGELVFAPASERGQYTIQELGLNDDSLVAARRRRLKEISRLMSAWYKADPLLRDGILEEIHTQLEQGEYRSSVELLLQVGKIPSSNVRATA